MVIAAGHTQHDVVTERLASSHDVTSVTTSTPALDARAASDTIDDAVVVEAGGTSTPPIPLDAAIAENRAMSRLSDSTRKAMEAHSGSFEATLPTHGALVVMTVPNPNYPGSPAASTEERKAAGYPDIEITLDDIRSKQDIIVKALRPDPTADDSD